ncbi:MAG TPA: cardiolipin synthase B [Verrucomicrobiales bacterium]|nr:cardiolipin synthase B [Verrucomicrobiales bacterium]
MKRPLSAPRKSNELKKYAAAAIAGGFVSTVLARNFFEYEKKITHPILVDYDVSDPQFRQTLSQLLGPPLVEGNSVTILENGAEIFDAMVAGIKLAQRTITFENFVFTHGRITRRLAEALVGRARKGVKVHFLQDAMGCDCVHGGEMRLLQDAGCEVEIFRYINLRFNERTHRKLLIIDGKVGFIGGVGISDAWDGHADAPNRWRDTQYRVEGPVVGQMQQAFMDNWIQTRGVVLHGEDYFPPLEKQGSLISQAFRSSSCEGADSARLMILFSIAAARKSIRIANAYFIPDDLTISTLIQARERGVEVEVITPGPLIDQRVARYVGRSRWKGMLESGVRFYEYQGALYHCKYMIVDDLWTSVGSCNFDNRSLRLNEEANLNVLDAEFATRHLQVFAADKAKATEITLEQWQARPMAEKIQGHLGCLLRSQL